jgi:chemotaxis protein MotB
MRLVAPWAWLALLVTAALAGCRGQNPFAPTQQAAGLSTEQQQQLAQSQEWQRRVGQLDYDNQDLHQRLAQSEQTVAVLQQDLAATRRQLSDTASQLADARAAQQEAQQQAETWQTATQRRGGATITANSGGGEALTAISISGVQVRQDGDVVRIDMPADQLFLRGTATIHQGGLPMLEQVAAALRQHYPRQRIGIEAHIDSDPVVAPWQSAHQLTSAQALAVFGEFSGRYQLDARGLFVLGHGANHPIASNGTLAGKAQNRRVEVVIYPDTW